MTIDPKYLDLIQADIDQETGPEDKAALEAFLAQSEEGRTLHQELSALAVSLDEMEELPAPTHLKHVIISSAAPRTGSARRASSIWRFFSLPSVGYIGTFAAGVILTLAIVESDRVSTGAFDDVTGMVGTVADVENIGPTHDSLAIQKSEVAGSVSLLSKGQMLILDFDLAAAEPIEIIARYSDQTIWFNGFAQLESSGTSVAAQTGEVKLEMDGKRRYVVFLNNPSDRRATIQMSFIARGEVIHEANLDFEG